MKRVRAHVVLDMLLGSLTLASIGCASYPIEPVRRAAREFSCPRERIAAVQRRDIASNVFDLNVCGAMVRYSCIEGEGGFVQCTREPPPARWDVDPARVATVPRPLSVPANLQTPAVCDSYAIRACLPCLEQDGRGWRWHPCVSGPGPTGEGTLN
jgi:hypothetical protein